MNRLKILIIGLIIMNLFSFCSNRKKDISEAPWKDYSSIFKHIKNNIDSTGKLSDNGDKLPDDSRRFKEGELKWVSGGMDGAFGHHGGSNQKTINKVAKLTKKISTNGKLEDKIELYNLLIEDNLMDFIDPTLEKIVNLNVHSEPHLHNWAKWLAFESPDRGAVKFGIALLGLIRDKEDLNKLLILGKHEEFTLFVAVAITNTFEKPETYLWELAKHVDGWGKISLVERLSETENPEIKKWMIYEGYKNNIMYEYLAYICATTGDLKTELSKNTNDTELIKSSGELIEALINGGPAEDISVYTDAGSVVKLYLGQTIGKVYTLDQFLILNTIKSYLSDKDTGWTKLSDNGWTDDLRANLLIDIDKELSLPIWMDLVNEKKNTNDNVEFWQVDRAASILNIDMWEIHWQRLINNPTESGLWFNVMKNANDERIDQIIELAMTKIDLERISTGAEDNMGLGEEYQLHSCLDFIIQDLDKFSGKGNKLILTALKSPVVRNRNMAIKALNAWDRTYINDEIKESIIVAEKVEPNEDTKRNLNKLINGQPID
ncbi:hypothetical protein [Zobellia uliginosa]|uniref:hypothetical protein n=1 Tax=Zobellia uliginosa TaxID=143224 RepID=UPI0026E173C7|nr:hypothetical protein [Zobellia uliginosa]MDO6518530.1 hypothetical protein [Zobellia uliginosa]